jgi:hypothetical protein
VAETKAKAEAATAKTAAATADEARVLERQIMEAQRDVAKKFEERKLPQDDPFGFKAYNKGE